MPVDPRASGSPQDWLRHARSDLALARMAKARGVLRQHLCFHAQQAAEKALKAVLVANGLRVVKTHDLAFLMQALPKTVSVPPPLINLPVLNQYAVQQRYPGEVPAITRKQHDTAATLAGECVAWAAWSIARANGRSARSG